MTNNVFAISSQASEYLRKARVYLSNKNLKAAEAYYQRAQEIDSESKDIANFGETLKKEIEEYVQDLSRQAFVYMQEKNLPKAESLYKEILLFFPEDKEAIAQLEEIKKVNTKIKEYKKQGIAVSSSTGRTFDLNAYSAISEYNRAYAFFKKGDRKKALEILNEMLSKEANYKAAQSLKEEIEKMNELDDIIEKAETYFQKESMENVVETVTELLQKAPDRYSYYLMRAKAYIKLKNYNRAKNDLAVYYLHTDDKENVFSLMSDINSFEGNYIIALGFAYDKQARKYNKTFGFIFKNYFYGYLWSNSFLIIFLIVMLPIALFYAWQISENFFIKFSISNMLNTFKCFFFAAINKTRKIAKDLENLSSALNYPWFNYFTGLVLLDKKDYIKALKFLKFASNSRVFKSRACYFHGLASKALKNKNYETSFEDSVLNSLDDLPDRIWNPWFMRKIEVRLLKEYRIIDDDSMESMANKLLSNIII